MPAYQLPYLLLLGLSTTITHICLQNPKRNSKYQNLHYEISNMYYHEQYLYQMGTLKKSWKTHSLDKLVYSLEPLSPDIISTVHLAFLQCNSVFRCVEARNGVNLSMET